MFPSLTLGNTHTSNAYIESNTHSTAPECWNVDPEVLSLCFHGDRSGFVGLPKVKRDKYSVFNFLTVTESRDPPGEFSPSLQAGGAVS